LKNVLKNQDTNVLVTVVTLVYSRTALTWFVLLDILILGVLTYSFYLQLFTVAGTVTALNRVPYKLAKNNNKVSG